MISTFDRSCITKCFAIMPFDYSLKIPIDYLTVAFELCGKFYLLRCHCYIDLAIFLFTMELVYDQ